MPGYIFCCICRGKGTRLFEVDQGKGRVSSSFSYTGLVLEKEVETLSVPWSTTHKALPFPFTTTNKCVAFSFPNYGALVIQGKSYSKIRLKLPFECWMLKLNETGTIAATRFTILSMKTSLEVEYLCISLSKVSMQAPTPTCNQYCLWLKVEG